MKVKESKHTGNLEMQLVLVSVDDIEEHDC